MGKGGSEKTVLILDDEPEYLQWVGDFLESKGLLVRYVRTLAEGRKALKEQDYRLLLVDMNVPGTNAVDPNFSTKYPIILKYPGLALAVEARGLGYGAHSVIAYTVHDDDEADKEMQRLYCRYVLKGRPEALKKVVEASLRPTPSKRHRASPRPVRRGPAKKK